MEWWQIAAVLLVITVLGGVVHHLIWNVGFTRSLRGAGGSRCRECGQELSVRKG